MIHHENNGADESCGDFCIFRTNLGWCGFAGRDGYVERVWIGHRGEQRVRRRAEQVAGNWSERDWFPDLRERLTRFADGCRDEFADIPIVIHGRTTFARSILQTLRQVPYGATMSYGQLASFAGHPRAARAVGRVMAENRLPILIPCHRVVASGGLIGGFSAPTGIALKRRLLRLEGHNCF